MHFLSRHRLLILTIICFAIGVATLRPKQNNQILESERQEFISSFHHKELLAEQLVDTLLNYATSNNLKSFANSDTYRPDRLYDRHGIILYVYSGRNLIYWTNNTIAIPEGTNWYKTSFLHTGNAYIVPKYKASKKITVVSAIVIKEEYQYENEFLHNRIHPSYNIHSNLTINSTNENSENVIYNSDGIFLFSFGLEKFDNTNIKRRLAFPMLLLSLLLLLLYAQQGIKKNRLSNHRFFFIAIIAITVRAGIQAFLPQEFYNELSIFTPQHFSSSVIFPTIGDLLITVILIVYLIFVYFYKVHLQRIDRYSWLRRMLILIIWICVLIGIFGCINHIIYILIHDSNFQVEIYEFTSLSIYSAVAHLIIVLCLVGFLFLLNKAAIQFLKAYSLWESLLILISISTIVTFLWFKFDAENANIATYIAFIILSVLWFYLQSRKQINFATTAVVVGLFAAYVTIFIRTENQKRQFEESQVIAINLSQVQDPTTEIVLSDVIEHIKADEQIVTLLQQENNDYDNLNRYLQSQYFIGYLSRYNVALNVYDQRNISPIGIDSDKSDYYTYYNRYLRRYGVQTPISGLFQIKDPSSETTYLVRIKIPISSNYTITLFIELSQKLNYESLGYPELLLDKPLQTDKYRQNICYAKYQNGLLATHSGTFPYAFNKQVYGENTNEFNQFRFDHYDHVLYNNNNDNCIIVSTPTVTTFNLLISFTYIFVFFILIITILLVFANPYTKMFDIRFTIKNKVLMSILIILLLSSISVVVGVVYYTINHYQRSQNEIMTTKVQSVLIEIEQRYANINNIKRIPTSELNNMLSSFSNIFFTDINIYDPSGSLVATSRREIYTRKLTSEIMNATAFRELEMNHKSRIVQKENIGGLEYYSAYVPLINTHNKLLAYINLPYFIKQTPLQQELTSVAVAVINIYVVLILLSILIAIFLSNRITQPLLTVRQRIKNIDIGKRNQRVEYDGDDEIAELVNEYNLMLDELSISATRLAKSERESAWREMARQVAHEIKNPLTPMKLSVQLLERAHRNGDPDFGERFANTSRTLIEQIDSLSSIASEFSQFARMPEGRTEIVNLNERIVQSVELFKNTTNTKITFTAPAGRTVTILADNERMLQVFNNLIKNAIQAIPKKRKGQINITLRYFKGRAVVEVQDNGIGITPETEAKLFQPNFTTKTSGTGLGLAIVKNIVEEAGGAIWFYSKPGKGTSFFVSFPLATE